MIVLCFGVKKVDQQSIFLKLVFHSFNHHNNPESKQINYISESDKQMFGSFSGQSYLIPKPEQDLYNISFFEPSKSYDMLSINKTKHLPHHQFSSWSDKDEQFLQFNYRNRKDQMDRKQSADSRIKRTSNEKFKMSHSVAFHTNKIDLGSRMPESPQKLSLKTKSQSMFVEPQRKTSFDLKNYLENRSELMEKSKQKSKLMQKLRQKLLEQSPKKYGQLETQPSYNLINYPITTVLRKRRFKKIQKFPFPSLAYRLNR